MPVAVYLVAVWALHASTKSPGPMRTFGAPVAAALGLATSWTPEPVLLTGLVLVALVVVAMTVHHRQG